MGQFTRVGWVWIDAAWHLNIARTHTVCGRHFNQRLEGPEDGPRCRQCVEGARRYGIRL